MGETQKGESKKHHFTVEFFYFSRLVLEKYMLAYLLIYLIPLIALILPISFNKNISNIGHLSFGVLLIIFIGTRYEIGGDWYRYFEIYEQYSVDVFINNS